MRNARSIARDDRKVTLLDHYRAVAGYARQVENRAWTALYNFLTCNAILVVAWATIYVRDEKPPSGNWGDWIMLVMSAIGFLLGLGWSSLGARNFAYNKLYATKMEDIEEKMPKGRSPQSRCAVAEIRGRGAEFILGRQPVILAGTPLLFAALYVLLGVVVLRERFQAGDLAVLAVVVFTSAAWIWAIVDCVMVLNPRERSRNAGQDCG